MAITISDTEPRIQYTATAGQTSFTVPFAFFANADLQVFNGTSQLSFNASPSNATQYSVTGAGVSGGGSITLGSPGATVNDVITIVREVAIERTTDFPTSGAFQIDSLNTELDKIIAMAQQLERDLKLSPRVNTTSSSSFNLTFPDMVAGKVLSANAGGTGLEFSVDASGLLSAETNAATSATNAANSATASANSATAASNAQAAAEAALDTFDDDFLGSKTSDPSVDNDGNALSDGALYFNTTDNVMKVYDLGNTQWKQLVPTSSQQTNIDAAVANATNINSVASQISPSNNISTLAGISSDITTLAAMSGLSTLAGSATAVTTVANNLTAVQNFADLYRIASSAPTSSLNVGDLYFDTTQNELKVYKSSGWASAGSSVNGTSARFRYVATASQTVFTGADANGNTMNFDSGFADVYLNGVKLVSGASNDYTETGTTITLASGAASGDILEVVGFGTFNVASIAASSITSGILPTTRGGTGVGTLGSAGQALVVNAAANALEFANASSAEVYGFNLSFVPSTINYTVSVQSVGGANKYFILGTQQKTLELEEGNTYVFSYPSAHPFALSTTSDGSHGGGSEYTTGVTRNSSANTLTFVVPASAPQLYYYCTSHSGMGGQANTPAPVNNNLQVTTTNQGQDSISASTYAGFDDVIFAASGFTFSLSDGDLIATV